MIGRNYSLPIFFEWTKKCSMDFQETSQSPIGNRARVLDVECNWISNMGMLLLMVIKIESAYLNGQ